MSPMAASADVTGEIATKRNVAIGQTYTLSVAPNYGTARANAPTLLADGQAAEGSFWQNGTTLGWSRVTPVTISISLAEPRSVSEVHIQAGAKTSGEIYYPSQVLLFGGDGAGRYGFLGATGLQLDQDSPADAALRMFKVSFAPRILREVVAVAFSRGPYLFLGEVAALEGEGGTALEADLTSLDAVRADAAARRRESIAALPGPQPTGPSEAQRWAMPIAAKQAGSGRPDAASCGVERIEPWPDRAGEASEIAADAPLIALAGGRDYAAFRVSNAAASPAPIRLKALDGEAARVRWSALAHVQAYDYSWVPDVVAPFEEGDLPPRSTMTVLAEVEAARTGETDLALEITCGDRASRFVMPARILDSPADTPAIHGNLWTYLHEPQHAPVAQALACNPDFLRTVSVDTAVVHPSALLGESGDRPAELLAQYFRSYRNARRVLLYMDVRTRPWPFRKMPDEDAAADLREWWGWVQSVAKAQGLKGEIILYPIDEPQPGDVALLLRTRNLFRRAGVKARVYATAESKSAPALQSLDILQLHRPTSAMRGSLKVAELEAYDTRRDAKLLSVNGYYRMQGWQAFQLGLTGIGLWSAWDSSGSGDPASGWNPFTGARERDFGMLYAAPQRCSWPSRRLLAWRRGIEENRILRSCAKQKPESDTTAKVEAAITTGRTGTARLALEKVVAGCADLTPKMPY
jgi:hypothetical protein